MDADVKTALVELLTELRGLVTDVRALVAEAREEARANKS